MRWEKEVSEGKEVARCTMIRFHVSFRENYKYLHRSFILLSGAIFRTAVTSIFISNKLHLVGRNAVSTSSPRFVAGSERRSFHVKVAFLTALFFVPEPFVCCVIEHPCSLPILSAILVYDDQSGGYNHHCTTVTTEPKLQQNGMKRIYAAWGQIYQHGKSFYLQELSITIQSPLKTSGQQSLHQKKKVK